MSMLCIFSVELSLYRFFFNFFATSYHSLGATAIRNGALASIGAETGIGDFRFLSWLFILSHDSGEQCKNNSIHFKIMFSRATCAIIVTVFSPHVYCRCTILTIRAQPSAHSALWNT
jgi:hypothetical protein